MSIETAKEKKNLRENLELAIKESTEIGKIKQEYPKIIRLHNKIWKWDSKQKEKREYDKSK